MWRKTVAGDLFFHAKIVEISETGIFFHIISVILLNDNYAVQWFP